LKKSTTKKSLKLTLSACAVMFVALIFMLNACTKSNNQGNCGKNGNMNNGPSAAMFPAAIQGNAITRILTVANIRNSANGQSEVMFNENPQILNVQNTSILATLQQALSSHAKVKVTFNPWQATIEQVNVPTNQEIINAALGPVLSNQGKLIKVDPNNLGDLDDAEKLGILNDAQGENTHEAITNIIPDMATAQTMFNYIARQCCKLSGPYDVDYCISFQYCEDGCYARAHKMWYIMSHTYHYATHKIFSFARTGNDVLSVEAEKWGGCCINWWFHVTILVSINTPGGVKAYVFDPAMFDQPVLLSAWLHAQENPTCAGGSNPLVDFINLQPNPSYCPSDYTGLNFDTDPYFASTDSTLVHYSPLTTCP
jgi:hypothetical protein